MNAWPPTVIVPARAPALLTSTLNTIVAFPVPLLPLAIVNHVESLAAFHVHQLPVDTANDPLPPLALNAWLEGEML